MANSGEWAEALTALRGDRFAAVREEALAHCAEHGCTGTPATTLRGREIGVLVRATHASYVLELGTGLGYSGLQALDGFGRTGRLDTIESDPAHAKLAEENFRRFGFEERVRVHRARDSEVAPALNGPYDLVMLDSDPAGYAGLYEHLLRLVRTGGSLLVSAGGETEARELFERLAVDERVAARFGPLPGEVLAVRVR